MRKLIVIAMCITILSGTAFAAVPVKRVDSVFEKLFLARYVDMQAWMENVAYSITNTQTIGDLIALPEKLKDIIKGFNDQNLISDLAGNVVNIAMGKIEKVMKGGDGDEALEKLSQYIGIKDIMSGDFDGLVDEIVGAIKNIPLDGIADGVMNDMEEKDAVVAKASVEATVEVAETVPMSLPSVLTQTSVKIVKESPTPVRRAQNVLSVTQGAKLNLMEEYAGYIAKYSGEEPPYRKTIETILNDMQATLENIKNEKDHMMSKGSVQEALVNVSAGQVVMLGLQNAMLANLIDVMADEIVLMSKIGIAGAEGYARNLQSTMEDQIKVYEVISDVKSR